MVDLNVDLGFCKLKNPLITASGTFGYGEEFTQFFDLDILGALVLKGFIKMPDRAIRRRAYAKPLPVCSIPSAWPAPAPPSSKPSSAA